MNLVTMNTSEKQYENDGGGGGGNMKRMKSSSSKAKLLLSSSSTTSTKSLWPMAMTTTTLLLIGLLQFMTNIIHLTNASEITTDLNVKSSIKNNDESLKNFKLIHSQMIPDVTTILQSNDERYETLKQFVSTGWPVLESQGYKTSKDIPFTIIVPKLDLYSVDKGRLKDIVLEHLVPGKVFDTFNEDELYGNSIGHTMMFKKLDKLNESQWTLNGLKILRTLQINDKIATIFIDGFLSDRKSAFAKRNIQETNRYNEPQRLEMKNITKNELIQQPPQTSSSLTISTTANNNNNKDTKLGPLMTFLSSMKSGTKVFQHFLSKSNLTQAMDKQNDGGGSSSSSSSYTVLIPSDNAFQRWHPIDWGFYPFSVQDFTENVLRNHFLQLQTPLRMADIKNAESITFRTLGGETVVFRSHPTPTVNNVSILADYTLPNGNQVFIISEVLFVSEAVVSRLHQMHKDKETPPLLAFPWFGAQFLSHSFLALERDPRCTQITRYLNNAEIAPYISGANYTFFVPIDEAFERLGLDLVSDDILASPKGIKMLLHHFVKGRLYDRDLQDNEVFETIGGGSIKIQRRPGQNVTVNNAKIIESEVFVYNLGTMFYIDDILYSDILKEYAAITTTIKPNGQNVDIPSFGSGSNNQKRTANSQTLSPSSAVVTESDVELVPSEFTEQNAFGGDVLLHDEDDDDDEIITPKALPVSYNFEPPKK